VRTDSPFSAVRQSALAAAAIAILAGHGSVLAQAAADATTDAAPPLELIVLGSGGPAALGRAASSYLVLLDGKPRILVDAGPGSFVRAGEAHVSLDALDVVLLTHLHVDHAAELPGFVKARAVATGQPIHFEVFGPVGQAADGPLPYFPSTSHFVSLLFGAHGAFAYLRDFAAPVSLHVTDLRTGPAAAHTILAQGPLSIRAAGGHHGDAPAILYRIDYRERSIVFSGDIDAHGLPALAALAREADLLVFNAVVLDPPGSPPILYTLHTPPTAIGALAAAAKARAVLLSHLSPAVDGAHAAVAAAIAAQYHGSVTFAADGMRVPL
jgi:ribonuclease BN (tRNA processing enzyme)